MRPGLLFLHFAGIHCRIINIRFPPSAGVGRVRRFWSPSSLDGARTKTRVRESGVILRSLPSCLSSRGQSCPTLHASCLRSGSNQRPGSMCADQHREEAGRRVKMAACGWAGWDLHSSFFRHPTIPMSPQTRSDRRVIIFASFTRLCAVPDRANDIDTLRGPPVARDRGPAQWQVFRRGPWKRVILIPIPACRTLGIVRCGVERCCWRCHVCVFGVMFFKGPPHHHHLQGLKQGPASQTVLLAYHYLNTPPDANADASLLNDCLRRANASGLSPCFCGRIGSQSKLR